MRAMQWEAPVTADPEALQKALLSTSFSGDSAQLKMHNFELELDQSRFSGEMSVKEF